MADYGLLGHPLAHSISPEIHKVFGYDYELYDITADRLGEFVKGGLKGYNVTIPYKKDIIPYLDAVDEVALKIGAVNTVVNRGGKLYGYNTDILGMEYALVKSGIDLKGKSVMILGSGGTSNTAKTLAETMGASKVTIVSRSRLVNYTNYTEHVDTEIIINTTPVGMYPNIFDSIVDLDAFPHLLGGFDVVYNPLKTEFVRAFENKGLPCANGLMMLVAQAKYARDIFMQETTCDDIIDEVYRNILAKLRNIVLIGMPGCGKTSIAYRLATKHKRVLMDTDRLVTDSEDKSIPEIFDEVGEDGFRDIEERAILNIAGYRGAIISCGGGVILREQNIINLKRNGIVVYIKRDLSKLVSDGRPLSNSVGVEKLYERRRELYERYADIIVDNNTTIEDCVRKIEESTL